MEQGLRDNDPKQIAEGYYLLGKYEEKMNNFTEAYRLFRQALAINESIRDHEKTERLYIRFSLLELKQKHFEKALEYAREAIRISIEYDLPKNLRSAYNQMGSIYLESARRSDNALSGAHLDSALYYFNKTEAIARSEKNEHELAKSRFKLGNLYRKKGDRVAAVQNLQYAAEISKKQIPNEAFAYHTNLALAWIELGAPAEAAKVLSECQDMIDSGIRVIPLHKAYYYFIYALYHQAVAEWQQAIELNAKAFKTFRQINANERKAHFPVRLDAMLNAQQKDLLLKISSIETETKGRIISRQQLAMIILAVFFTALVLFSWFLYRSYRKQRSLSRKNEFLIREQHHRVKNNLQVISSMLSLQSDYLTDEASKATLFESQTRINSMVLLHRQLYENDNVELIDIGMLFQEVINSVALTFGVHNFQARLHIGERFLETDMATSIGVVVNELVINSFKHAFADTRAPIELSTRKTGDTMEITYKDSGNKDISGLFDNPGQHGFGLTLIGMILFQIDGKMKYRFENGSVFTITFKP